MVFQQLKCRIAALGKEIIILPCSGIQLIQHFLRKLKLQSICVEPVSERHLRILCLLHNLQRKLIISIPRTEVSPEVKRSAVIEYA